MKDFIELLFPLHSCTVKIIIFLSSTIVSLLGYMGITYFVAARKFQDIIRNELQGLYPSPVSWPKDSFSIDPILKEKYPRIENAVSNFKGHLPTILIKGFNKAWIKYYSANGNEGYQCYDHYMPFKGEAFSYGEKISEWDNTKTYKETFKKNVARLLKYAKQI